VLNPSKSATKYFHYRRPFAFQKDVDEETKKGGAGGSLQVAIILSGCGYLDGTDVTEAASGMIDLARRGLVLQYFAPDGKIEEVYDHLSKTLEKNEVRNIASEATRISKANVQKLSRLKASNFDALFVPGGNGVGRNLSNYFEDNINFNIHPELEKALQEMQTSKKPILLSGLASILAARVWGKFHGGPGCKITLGNDANFIEAANALGATHVTRNSAADIVGDEENLIISTPGYLIQNATPWQVFQGISGLYEEITNFSQKTKSKGGLSQDDLKKKFAPTVSESQINRIISPKGGGFLEEQGFP